MIVDHVDQLSGEYVEEERNRVFRTCRLMIGMHRPNEEYIRMLYGKNNKLPDAEMVQRCKLQIALEFKKQLLLGLPTKQDEWTLRRLSAQMKEKKVCVKYIYVNLFTLSSTLLINPKYMVLSVYA